MRLLFEMKRLQKYCYGCSTEISSILRSSSSVNGAHWIALALSRICDGLEAPIRTLVTSLWESSHPSAISESVSPCSCARDRAIHAAASVRFCRRKNYQQHQQHRTCKSGRNRFSPKNDHPKKYRRAYRLLRSKPPAIIRFDTPLQTIKSACTNASNRLK